MTAYDDLMAYQRETEALSQMPPPPSMHLVSTPARRQPIAPTYSNPA